MITTNHNIDNILEENILGNLILDITALDKLEELEAKHFVKDLHQRIFRTLQQLDKERTFSMTNLAHAPGIFTADERLALITLKDNAESDLNLEEAAQTIIELWRRREIAQEMKRRLTQLESGKLASQEAFEPLATVSYDDITHQQVSLLDCIEVCANELETQEDEKRVIKTELYWLDNIIKGFYPGDLIILGGRPGLGKTAFGVTVAYTAATRGKHVLFNSLEMTKQQLTYRILSRLTGKKVTNRAHLNDGSLPNKIRDIGKAITDQNLVFHIDETPGIKFELLRQRSLRFHRQYGLDLLVIDYLGLMANDPKNMKVHELAAITSGLKSLAKELNIPVLLLCQLSRESMKDDKKAPQLHHLRDSGAIEQDADIVMFVYSKEPKDKKLPKQNVQIIVAKHRHGPTGTAEFLFNGPLTLFENLPD